MSEQDIAELAQLDWELGAAARTKPVQKVNRLKGVSQQSVWAQQD